MASRFGAFEIEEKLSEHPLNLKMLPGCQTWGYQRPAEHIWRSIEMNVEQTIWEMDYRTSWPRPSKELLSFATDSIVI